MNVVKLILSVLLLVCKVPGLFISFFYHRRIGVQAFERELRKNGISAREAAELAEIYKRMVFPGIKRMGRLVKSVGPTQNS